METLLDRPDLQQHIQGYRQLVQQGDPEAFKQVRARLEAEKEKAVRAAVAELLRPCPHPEALAVLVHLAKDPDARVRVFALKSLESRAEPDGLAVLIAMMFDGEATVSKRAEKAAMDMGKERLVALLGDMAKSDRPWKVKAALKAAGRINTRQMVPILEGAHLFGDEPMRELARESLEALAARGNPAATELLERIRMESGNANSIEVAAAPARPLPPSLAESDEMPIPPMGARVALGKIRSLEEDDAVPLPPPSREPSGSGHRIPLGSLTAASPPPAAFVDSEEPTLPPDTVPEEILLKPVRGSAFNQAGGPPREDEDAPAAPPPRRTNLNKRADGAASPPRPEPRKRGTGLNRPPADAGDPVGGMVEPAKVATRVCPMCAEEIPRASIQCHLCGEVLARPSGGKSSPTGEDTADWRLRLVSNMADSFAAGFLNLIPFGFLLSLPYLLFKDSLSEGSSPGKQSNHLRTIDDATGAPCTKGQSVLRNIILMVPFAVVIELFFVIFSGRRLGDRLAGTRVIRPSSAPPPRWVANYIVLFFFVVLPILGFVAAIASFGTGAAQFFASSSEHANQRACFANQKVMMGAIEMFRLDKGMKPEDVIELTPEFLEDLKKNGYIMQIPTDPGEGPGSTGNYMIIQPDPITIGCSRHGSVTNPPSP